MKMFASVFALVLTNAAYANTEKINPGIEILTNRCTICHMENATSPDFSNPKTLPNLVSDSALWEKIENYTKLADDGSCRMPADGSCLTVEERETLLGYLKTLKLK